MLNSYRFQSKACKIRIKKKKLFEEGTKIFSMVVISFSQHHQKPYQRNRQRSRLQSRWCGRSFSVDHWSITLYQTKLITRQMNCNQTKSVTLQMNCNYHYSFGFYFEGISYILVIKSYNFLMPKCITTWITTCDLTYDLLNDLDYWQYTQIIYTY